MTVRSLIRAHELRNPDSYMFSPGTLRFFGERVSEMRVLKQRVTIAGRECYVLSSLQRNAPGGPTRSRYYFDTETFERVMA